MPKIKLEVDFKWKDRVKIITNPEEIVFGVVTELICSENEVRYKVASDINDKECYASELELVENTDGK